MSSCAHQRSRFFGHDMLTSFYFQPGVALILWCLDTIGCSTTVNCLQGCQAQIAALPGSFLVHVGHWGLNLWHLLVGLYEIVLFIQALYSLLLSKKKNPLKFNIFTFDSIHLSCFGAESKNISNANILKHFILWFGGLISRLKPILILFL